MGFRSKDTVYAGKSQKQKKSHGLFWKPGGQWKWSCLKLRVELLWLDGHVSGPSHPSSSSHWISTAGGGLQHGLGAVTQVYGIPEGQALGLPCTLVVTPRLG